MAISTDRIPAIVRARREQLGISREKLAATCNVSASTITRLELQSRLPGTATMFAIAEALDLDLNALVMAELPAA